MLLPPVAAVLRLLMVSHVESLGRLLLAAAAGMAGAGGRPELVLALACAGPANSQAKDTPGT